MNRALCCCLKLGLFLMVVLSGTVFASSDVDRNNLKMKLAAGVQLSQTEIEQIIDLHNAGTPLTDQWQLEQLKEFGRIGDRPAPSRRPGSTLDEYVCETITYDWLEISAIGTEHLLEDDEAVIVNLPFEFPFYDQAYGSISLGANGYIVPGGTDLWSQTWNWDPIPNEWDPNNFIAIYWRDLNSSLGTDGHVYTYHDVDNGRFVIQYDSVDHYGWPPPDLPETFECFLYPSGRIVYQYQTVADAIDVTVGIENQAGNDGMAIWQSNSGTFCPAENLALQISQPDGVPNPVTEHHAEVSGPDVVLTWQDPVEDTNGNPLIVENVQIWLGDPDDGTLVATVGGGVQTYTHVNAPEGYLIYSLRPFTTPYFGRPVWLTAIVGTPSYRDDFEQTEGLWSSDNPGGWQWGTPDFTDGPQSAFSGNSCWGTVLTGNYADGVCYNLTLELELAVAETDATVEFWAWYSSEQSFDGCHFKVSTDEGNSWELITPVDGYTQPNVFSNNCIGDSIPCWAGDEDNWHYIVLPIGEYAGQVLQFRFTFGTDGSVVYPGFYFDDLSIWGLQEPVLSTVSGQVTLDGGAGNIENTLIRANGVGSPHTNPAANGSYLLDNVLIGDRTIRGSLNGYNDASVQVTVTEAGPNVANLTLVRSDPPLVTGLTGSVSNATGEVTLNWDDSPDPLVDTYYIYSRVHNTSMWNHVATSATSQATFTLTVDGIWELTVTAIDENVSTPVESDYAPFITLLYGALPPTSLTAIGYFDDKIRLNWLEPGNDFGRELVYDDGTAEAFMTVNATNGSEDRMAVIFTPPSADEMLYPIEVSAFAIFLEDQTTIEELSICPPQTWDSLPNIWEPYAVWNGLAADAAPGWLSVETAGSVIIEEPTDFWLVVRFSTGLHGPGIGGDNSESNNRSYYGQWTWEWVQDLDYDYMMRAWVRSSGGMQRQGEDVYLLSVGGPEGYKIESIPRVSAYSVTTSDDSKSIASKFEQKSFDKNQAIAANTSKAATAAKSKQSMQVTTRAKSGPAQAELTPYVKAPELELQSREPNDNLDDLDHYIVYRDGVDIGHPNGTTFDDVGVAENVPHSYYVTSHYDDGDESAPSNTTSAACNMAPAAPGNLAGTPLGTTQMRLDWANPTTNQDGTPLTDLAAIRIYRDGSMIGSVGPTTTTYTDSPPDNDQPYVWTVRAVDEVPNISLDSEPFTGYVVSPWEEVEYEWIDISTIGTVADVSGDDDTGGPYDLGFSVEFFGNNYSSVRICSNGWASFTSTATEYWNTEIPNPDEPNAAMYPFWDDLWVPETGRVLYYADAQNSRFIITWDRIPHLSEESPNNFQIVISENGGIQFNYETLNLSQSPDNTVGVENADGTAAVLLCYDSNGPWCAEQGHSVSLWGRPQGEIRGQVRVFGSNAPIENASIWSIGSVDTAYTDAAGFYSLPVDTGMHTVVIYKRGYCNQIFENIHIADNQSYVQNASMLWPSIGFSVTSINLFASPGHNVTGEFAILNQPSAGCQVDFSITTDEEWLSVSITEGTIPVSSSQTITVYADVLSIPEGEYNANVTIVHNDEGSPYVIPVNMVVGLDENPEQLPTEFAFHQNYPNPFNATTYFGIDLPIESRVELVIYNVMGQQVAAPVRANYPAGRHSVMFSAEALPSGMYIARLHAGEFTAMQKIVLLK